MNLWGYGIILQVFFFFAVLRLYQIPFTDCHAFIFLWCIVALRVFFVAWCTVSLMFEIDRAAQEPMSSETIVSERSTCSLLAWRVRACFYVCLFCAAWNLFGDVCFIDFYLSHNTFEDFGTIDSVLHPSDIFDFGKSWPVKLAQSGGWMYPYGRLQRAILSTLGLFQLGAGNVAWRRALYWHTVSALSAERFTLASLSQQFCRQLFTTIPK